MARENFFEAGRPKVLEPYPDWLFQWFDQHAIGARVVEKFGVHAAIYRDSDCIAFPYRAGETVLGKKIRSRKTDNQTFDGASPAAFFGAHMLAEGAITWADDEMAVLAFAECGVDNVIGGCSVDGLKTHDDVIGRAPRIVLAGATDKPGLVLREEMARRLGRHRCWLAAWPDGCKDAGQTLRDRGPDAVLAALQAAQPYPIDGVQRISATALLALRGRPAPVTMTTGALATDRILKLPTEGRLIVVTGWPGAGKTVWLRYVMVHTARNHGRRWAVFSPEMQPWEQFAAECAEVYSGKPFYPTPGVDSMTETEIGEAGDWLSGKVTMLVCDAEDQAPTLEWIMERARATVLRDGVTDLVIDPWNEVDLLRTERQVETEAIGRALQRLKAFGQRHGCNVWIIAHPAKPPPLKPNETRGAPGLYDLAGSAHFANKSDLGIVVNSPVPGFADLHLVKARFRRFGTKNTEAKLEYNALNGTYSTPAGGPSQEGHQPAHWQDFDDAPLAGGLS